MKMEKIDKEHKIKYPKHIHEEGKSIVSRMIGHQKVFKSLEEEEEHKLRVMKK